jgi:hypothetical protein
VAAKTWILTGSPENFEGQLRMVSDADADAALLAERLREAARAGAAA